MQYKSVPFVISVSRNSDPAGSIASALETLINRYAQEGWEYVRLENINSEVLPSSGCFGFGAKPGYNITRHVAVFKKP